MSEETEEIETTSGRVGGIDLSCEPNPCPLCGDEKGIKKYNHCYSCATLWRRRRQNREATYTEKETCGSCMFFHHSCGTPLNTFICRLPVGDADDEHRILEKKFIKPNGVCGEYRPNTSKRRLDYPWAEYHSDYLDWDDDKVEKKL